VHAPASPTDPLRPHPPSPAVVCRRLALPVAAALVGAVLVGVPQTATAQDVAGVPPGASLPGDPGDVASLDAIMAAVYDAISGPAGEARDWDRFRSLFMPGARLIPSGINARGEVGARVLTPKDYVAQVGPALEEGGFFEVELGRRVERYGPVVHVLSAYASMRAEDDPEPFARGVNSFQLLDAGDRWYVVSIFWASETPGNPLPPDLAGG